MKPMIIVWTAAASRHSIRSIVFLLLLASPALPQTVIHPRSDHLLKVNLLFVGAHPDDESGVTATFAREVLDHGARAAVVLATRGEGGGNAIGKELGPSLGILREAELRRATATYGVDLVYFLDKTDFFYTMSSQASFDVWNHDDALGRLVRFVRLLRPDVIVTMWPGPGTHGMHQAAARLATEAFSAAADPQQFPEQITDEYLRPWQPLKLYYNTDRSGSIQISTTDISLSRFMSYAEIEAIALHNYRSQGFGRATTLPPDRAGAESFLLVKSLVPVSPEETSLLDGITAPADPTISLAPPPSDHPFEARIAPRADIAEFRQWADRHSVAWAAGLLPAARHIGRGVTDTVMVEVVNRRNQAIDAHVALMPPPEWNMDVLSRRYTIPAQDRAGVPFPITVPPDAEQRHYPIRAVATAVGVSVADSGTIDVLPVTALTRASQALRIDGRLADWPDIPAQQIPAAHIWQGSLPGGDADCSGVFRAAYTDEYLYVAVEVTDDAVVLNIPPDDVKAPWRSDAIEIIIDPSGRSENTLTTFKAGIFPGTTAGRQARAMRDADANQGVIEKTAPGMRVVSSFTSAGYIIEAAIAWRDIPGARPPRQGDTLGFNIIIYDGDDTQAGIGANIGKARLGWSFRPNAQVMPYFYGRLKVE